MSKVLLPKFLTREIARDAVTVVVNLAFTSVPVKRETLHVVVLVPSMPDERAIADGYPNYPNLPITPHLLYEHSINRDAWEHKFDDVARCKALQLWHDRNDDRTDVMAHLLFPGDTPYWGGVKRLGIVVTCSGVQPWFDKMISGMVADTIIAMAYNAFMASDDRGNGVDFLT